MRMGGGASPKPVVPSKNFGSSRRPVSAFPMRSANGKMVKPLKVTAVGPTNMIINDWNNIQNEL
jgi:hypothetical protein